MKCCNTSICDFFKVVKVVLAIETRFVKTVCRITHLIHQKELFRYKEAERILINNVHISDNKRTKNYETLLDCHL